MKDNSKFDKNVKFNLDNSKLSNVTKLNKDNSIFSNFTKLNQDDIDKIINIDFIDNFIYSSDEDG